MAEYMFLIRNGDCAERSPKEMQEIMQRYMSYVKELRDKGHFKSGDELQSNGRLVSKRSGSFVDGPFVEGKEAIGGYFLIEAKDYDEAVNLAKQCPAVDHGGAVEVRAISLYN